MTEYLEGLDPNDIRNILNRMESRLAAVEQATLDVNQLADITPETGDIEFRAVDDEGRLRLILSAIDIFNEFGIHAHFAGFDVEGQPQFWLSADNGSGAFGGGLVTLSAEGMIVDGIGLPVKFIARDNNGDPYRIGTIGMGDGPALLLEFRDTSDTPTNLVEAIEDFSGSGTGVTWAVYQLDMEPVELQATKTGTGSGSAESDQFAVDEGESYEVSLRGGKHSGAGLIELVIEWYDDPSAGSLIGSTNIASMVAADGAVISGTGLAPTGAQGAKVVINVTFTDVGETVFYFLSTSVYALTLLTQFKLASGGASLNVPLSLQDNLVIVENDRRYMRPTIHDFVNDLDEGVDQVTIGSGTIANKVGESNHPGIRTLKSAASNNTGYVMRLASVDLLFDKPVTFEALIRPLTSVSQMVARYGLKSSFGIAVPSDGAWFEQSGLVLTPTLSVGGSAGTFSPFTMTINTWYRLVVSYGAHPTHPSVRFLIYDEDGEIVHSEISILGIPTSLTCRAGISAYRTNNVATDLVDVDWVALYSTTKLVR